MFIAGFHHLDRTRGTGWLDCPNCHEHAAQDVIDDMTFLQLLFYRFSPVRRKRMLVCRKCGFRRPATNEEMRHLETAGAPVHRAVMAPIGVLGLGFVAVIIGLIAWVGQSSANALADARISLIQESGQAVPVNFQGPSAWNYDPSTDPVPSMKVSDSGGRMYFVIKRVTDASTLEDLLTAHFNDEVGLTTTGFPSQPPAAKQAKVGGQNAIVVVVDYSQGAEKDQQQIFITAHNGVGYVITYVALGDAAIKTMTDMAVQVNKSIQWTAATETPPPAQSPSPGASPSPSPTH
ncbi:MAG TPA: hypothetical protein VN193_10555 [Candidatus Angelobacter sp.]|nr:hypothetical protein [Candidatus Angelobacter sp.]